MFKLSNFLHTHTHTHTQFPTPRSIYSYPTDEDSTSGCHHVTPYFCHVTSKSILQSLEKFSHFLLTYYAKDIFFCSDLILYQNNINPFSCLQLFQDSNASLREGRLQQLIIFYLIATVNFKQLSGVIFTQINKKFLDSKAMYILS